MRLYYRPKHPNASPNGFVTAADADLPEDTSVGLQINVDLNYSNLNLQDGTVVNSRRQHREYMKARGLTLSDDFKNTWAAAQKERESIRTGSNDTAARREAVARAAYHAEQKRRS